ncbi:MAG: signal peptidase I [Nitrososphaerota archaeon]|nr:signal peptidase I [Nitrososphaerota archaeon]MDG6940132.1 signal peptidase I [Nitrososphaerota archaeon]
MSTAGSTVSLALNVTMVVAVAIVGLNLLNVAGYAFPVEGISMLPAINTNIAGGQSDLAIVVPAKLPSLTVGDIVVYWNSYFGEYVIHRIVQIQGSGAQEYAFVKGDDRNGCDQQPNGSCLPVTNGLIAGKVVLVISYLGLLMEKPYNYVLVAVLLFVMAMDYLVSRKDGRAEAPA